MACRARVSRRDLIRSFEEDNIPMLAVILILFLAVSYASDATVTVELAEGVKLIGK